jgi:peptidyl-prolyl cis-trans isomerase C
MTFSRTLLALALAAALSGCDQMPMNASNEAGDDSQASAAEGTTAPAADTSEVIATVNGAPITRNLFEVYKAQRNQGRPGDPNGQNPEVVLDELINLELASQDGIRQGIDQQSEIVAQIAQQRRAVVASATLQQQLADHPVTDEELQAFYTEKTADVGQEFKARHILLKDEETAKNMIAELDKGADFGELAKEHSTGPSGPKGGELGWFAPGQMVKPFSDAVAKLEKGAYTKEPVKTQFGWHVIMLDDVRDLTPPPLEQVKKQLKVVMQNQRLKDYVAGLREKAAIEINEETMPAAPAMPENPHHGVTGEQSEMPASEQAAAEETPAAEAAPAESGDTTEATEEAPAAE